MNASRFGGVSGIRTILARFPMPSDSTGALKTILEGDSPENVRRAIAEYVLENGGIVRAIARRNLTTNTRAVHDSEDVLSSVLRRLDTLAADGSLRLSSERDLWAYISVIARNTAVSKTRLIEIARSYLTEDGAFAYEVVRRLNACRGDEEATILMHRMMGSLKDPIDRQVFALRYRGASHAAIGNLLGTTEEASRQRWRKICQHLRSTFGLENRT
jgi:DNA-directed RNA polymerase specialized sigma24 family protein